MSEPNSIANAPLAAAEADRLRRAAGIRAAARDWEGAAAMLGEAVALQPGDAATWFVMAKALENAGHPRRSHAAALKAQAAGPARWPHALALARLLCAWHEVPPLRALAASMQAWQAQAPVEEMMELADLLGRVDLHDEALHWVQQVLAREPRHVRALYVRGTTHLFLGSMDEARADFEQAIALAPDHAHSHWRLAELRAGDRVGAPFRVQRMRAQRERVAPGSEQDIYFSYALFDELHDLGEHDAAWEALTRGARGKRASFRYDAAADHALLASIAATCDAGFVAGPGHDGDDDEPTPLFIVGMFRSGTTLLERLLAGHPDIADAGESGGFFARLRLAADNTGPLSTGFLDIARQADPRALGADFMGSQRWRARGRRFWTEKLPANVLLAGFIARALPRARFLHMRRPPMDVCFSNLRMLFGRACAYSYDQHELAGYYRSYTALTEHWRGVLGDRWLDIDHADLVADPDTQMRRVLAHCGLPFDPSVLSLDDRGGAVSTASAAQVRDGIRKADAPAWWPYREPLRPLADALGVDPHAAG
ncbi:tetratricopeptide repeat-containing sulfotransferase family protein [Arenimonas daejeonensis]|uniref:tetratricopeptide repeat-containing sulfotransferase family protein n=1 Tax=Arenimonas daejeonensis TaxID=370777 RepID=UPI0011BF73B7|nr:sulfotransferase [Arenimonas daejeonensis]